MAVRSVQQALALAAEQAFSSDVGSTVATTNRPLPPTERGEWQNDHR